MRIAGITIQEKPLHIALTNVYGIGRSTAQAILKELGVDPGLRPQKVSEADEKKIRAAIESRVIEGDLRRDVSGNIKRLKDIQSYRGERHNRKLPVRGQRTKTNARTLKGAKKTMSSGKRTVEKK